MSRRLAQQRMTLSDLKWPFRASRVISVVAELVRARPLQVTDSMLTSFTSDLLNTYCC